MFRCGFRGQGELAAPLSAPGDRGLIDGHAALVRPQRRDPGARPEGGHRRIAPREPELTASEAADETLSLECAARGDQVIAVVAPGAVPNREADEAARFSVSALGTGWTLGPHRSHIIVTSRVEESCGHVERLTRHSRAVAAIAEATSAVAVYDGQAGATHDACFYVEVFEAIDDQLALMIWTGISVASEEGRRVSLLTLGMQQLGLPNLLLSAPKRKMGEALGFAFDLLAYQVKRGGPIPEGETVGRSASEKLKVRYVASPIRAGERVARVELK